VFYVELHFSETIKSERRNSLGRGLFYRYNNDNGLAREYEWRK